VRHCPKTGCTAAKEKKMTANTALHQKKKQEGLLAWDQRGVVIAWPDGHSRRFSWDMLRHLSLCEDCSRQSVQMNAIAQQHIEI